MNDLKLLGILFAVMFIISLVELVMSLKKIRLLNLITALIFLLASLYTFSEEKKIKIDPEIERRALSPNSISSFELPIGVYEYLDVWEITPFYLIPMRKVVFDKNEKNDEETESKTPKWSFVIFSARNYKQSKIPSKRDAMFGTFTGLLEVTNTPSNRVWSVVDIP